LTQKTELRLLVWWCWRWSYCWWWWY